tara:strand:+ start:743 stop:2170 length:1428 start_codon:yes stop_codon:yes gene_type:complete
MKNILLLIAFPLFIHCENSTKNKLVIDESDYKEVVEQIIEIDSVWSGHSVGFALLTHGQRQFIAYYNANRNMVVGQRNLSDDQFELHILPSPPRAPNSPEQSRRYSATQIGWDSHNYITMAVDKTGYLHLSGNIHVDPLTYFRSEKPLDITSLKQHHTMVGPNEKRTTYPKFMYTKENELLYHYRDGSSGNGNEIYNRYEVDSQQWKRMLDVPLTDGEGLMNAYQSQPEIREDGWYHVYWVWRDTPDCSTNHDLSYMKSPDLKNWYNVYDQPISLPATLNQKSLIVDPIPVKGGIINLAAKLQLDKNNKAVFTYHKYDQAGNLQIYIAQVKGQKWVYKQLTDWDYRWAFSGNGSIQNEFRFRSFKKRPRGLYEIGYWHIKYGEGIILLDEEFDPVGTVIRDLPLFSSSRFEKRIKTEGVFEGLNVVSSKDLGSSPNQGIRYVLKWEALDRFRDRPRPKPWPKPSKLYLYKLKKTP